MLDVSRSLDRLEYDPYGAEKLRQRTTVDSAPAPALAATEADAWTSARTQHAASAAAVKRAATTFTERGQPRESYVVNLQYRRDGFGANLRWNRFGSVRAAEAAADPSLDQTFGGKWLADLDLSYEITERIGVSQHLVDEGSVDVLVEQVAH